MSSPCNQLNKFKLSVIMILFFIFPVARSFFWIFFQVDPDHQHQILLSEKKIQMSETTTLKARNVMVPVCLITCPG